MSIAKPFTFVANTYAKASEVNADFDTVYAQVNTNISAIAQNATDIDNLENNKANINGDYSQRFAVANPTTNTDAVNKQYLISAIGNSIDYISGLVITKDSGSPEDTIIVSAGSCYDSTKSVVLSLSDATSKQNDNQGASTTYYVYVIGNDSGSSVDILISSSAVVPALPEGYTKFRQIGNYTTDSDSKIQNINNYSNSVSITTLIGSVIPDYTKGISIAGTAFPYTVTKYGVMYVKGITAGNDLQVLVNSSEVAYGSGWSYGGASNAFSNMFNVSVGDVVILSGTGFNKAIFYPLKGVN